VCSSDLVVATPGTGECRDSCEPAASRKNGRVIEERPQCFDRPEATTQADCELKDAMGKAGTWAYLALVFQNPMFRFEIQGPQLGLAPSAAPADRDKFFRFTTLGSFSPLLVSLTTDPSTLIQPQALSFLSPTGELVVTDGSINGLIFVSLSSVAFNRSFY